MVPAPGSTFRLVGPRTRRRQGARSDRDPRVRVEPRRIATMPELKRSATDTVARWSRPSREMNTYVPVARSGAAAFGTSTRTLPRRARQEAFDERAGTSPPRLSSGTIARTTKPALGAIDRGHDARDGNRDGAPEERARELDQRDSGFRSAYQASGSRSSASKSRSLTSSRTSTNGCCSRSRRGRGTSRVTTPSNGARTIASFRSSSITAT